MPLLENYCIWDPLLRNILTSLSWQDMGKINNQCMGGGQSRTGPVRRWDLGQVSKAVIHTDLRKQGCEELWGLEVRIGKLGAGPGHQLLVVFHCWQEYLLLFVWEYEWVLLVQLRRKSSRSVIDPQAVNRQLRCMKQMGSQPLPLPAFAFLVKSWQDTSSSHKSSVWPHPDGERGMFSIFIIIFLATHAIRLCKHPKISESKSLISYVGKSVVCNCSIGKVNGKWKARSRELIILCCRQN